MNIVYASSDSYSEVAAVSIVSLLENNRDAAELNLYCVEHGMKPENKARLQAIAAGFGRNIRFIPLPNLEEMLGTKLEIGYADVATFASCFLPAILPQTLQKALMLDCDTMVRGSLRELWDTDLSGVYAAAADDVKSKWYRRAVGITDDAPYINCGMMLLNLARCRQDQTVNKAVELLKAKQGKLLYMDQAVNNAIYSPAIRLLPPKYNCMSGLMIFNYRQVHLYKRPVKALDRRDFDEAVANPVILHFSDNAFAQMRPWTEGCRHPFAEEYRSYRAKAGYGSAALWPDKASAARKALRLAYRVFPRTWVAWGMGFLQADLQPRLKRKM